jgi:transcriptional regulator with XRE-family HTH domain
MDQDKNLDFAKKLGHLIRVRRKEQKISIRVVADATNIHPGAIVKFELGKTDMTISRVGRMMEYLRIKWEDLQILQAVSNKEVKNGK